MCESELLAYVLHDPHSQWADLFDDAQLRAAIAGIRQIFAPHVSIAYQPVTEAVLAALMERLINHLPPVLAGLSEDGSTQLTEVAISQTLYAGWAYWLGRAKLANNDGLPFLETNRLCDLALLQQHAINKVIAAGVK
jgi:hypothetical protein